MQLKAGDDTDDTGVSTTCLSADRLPQPFRVHPVWSEPAQRPADRGDPPIGVPAPETVEEAVERRIVLATSCRDTDHMPRVEQAGEVVERDGHRVQLMHNGVRIVEDCYCGPWMTETIRRLRGCHEPQEEAVFHAVVERLSSEDSDRPVMIELGSFWAYYGLWFLQAIPRGHVIAVEPDAAYLEVGRVNARINGAEDRMRFVHAAVGGVPGERISFLAQSDGQEHDVVQHDLGSLMDTEGVRRADLVLADIQGYESVLVERARQQFHGGSVRFLIVSTHQHSVSGDPLTHQRVLQTLIDSGAHVIAEHSVPESFSGDGLIAVSFNPADADLRVDISRARAQDSIYGDLEFDLAAEVAYREAVRNRLCEQNAVLRSECDLARAELAAMRHTRLWRWSTPVRSAYARVRPGRPAHP
jgi:FkbM family methyltransferase